MKPLKHWILGLALAWVVPSSPAIQAASCAQLWQHAKQRFSKLDAPKIDPKRVAQLANQSNYHAQFLSKTLDYHIVPTWSQWVGFLRHQSKSEGQVWAHIFEAHGNDASQYRLPFSQKRKHAIRANVYQHYRSFVASMASKPSQIEKNLREHLYHTQIENFNPLRRLFSPLRTLNIFGYKTIFSEAIADNYAFARIRWGQEHATQPFQHRLAKRYARLSTWSLTKTALFASADPIFLTLLLSDLKIQRTFSRSDARALGNEVLRDHTLDTQEMATFVNRVRREVVLSSLVAVTLLTTFATETKTVVNTLAKMTCSGDYPLFARWFVNRKLAGLISLWRLLRGEKKRAVAEALMALTEHAHTKFSGRDRVAAPSFRDILYLQWDKHEVLIIKKLAQKIGVPEKNLLDIPSTPFGFDQAVAQMKALIAILKDLIFERTQESLQALESDVTSAVNQVSESASKRMAELRIRLSDPKLKEDERLTLAINKLALEHLMISNAITPLMLQRGLQRHANISLDAAIFDKRRLQDLLLEKRLLKKQEFRRWQQQQGQITAPVSHALDTEYRRRIADVRDRLKTRNALLHRRIESDHVVPPPNNALCRSLEFVNSL